MKIVRIVLLSLLIIASTLAAPTATAQEDCFDFRAIGQARLLVPDLLIRDGDVWGGHIYAKVGDDVMTGMFSGNDGDTIRQGAIGHGRGGTYKIDLKNGDTLTLGSTNAVWPWPPGQNGFGYFRTSAKVLEGTGRFAHATGNVHIEGSFFFFLNPVGPPSGMWDTAMSGSVCSVEPAAAR